MSKQNVHFRVCHETEASAIADFLWSMKEDFRFGERSIVEEVTQLLFDKGGVIGGYSNDTMVGLFGYFFGEPSRDYANKDVGFIYIAGVANPFRCTRAFRNGIIFLAETLSALSVTEIRCHARADDAYTNRLYARILSVTGMEKNRRGDTCILYATSTADALALTQQWQQQYTPRKMEFAVAG